VGPIHTLAEETLLEVPYRLANTATGKIGLANLFSRRWTRSTAEGSLYPVAVDATVSLLRGYHAKGVITEMYETMTDESQSDS